MSWLDVLRRAGGSIYTRVAANKLDTGLFAAQVGMAGGAAVMTQKGFRTAMKRADKMRQLGAMDRQLAAIDATRRLSTIRASSATPGTAHLGVRGSYGSPVDNLLYAEAAELKKLERMEMAHRYLVKDIEEEAKELRLGGFLTAGRTLLGGAADYAQNLRLGRMEREGLKVRSMPLAVGDFPGGGYERQRKKIDVRGGEVLG